MRVEELRCLWQLFPSKRRHVRSCETAKLMHMFILSPPTGIIISHMRVLQNAEPILLKSHFNIILFVSSRCSSLTVLSGFRLNINQFSSPRLCYMSSCSSANLDFHYAKQGICTYFEIMLELETNFMYSLFGYNLESPRLCNSPNSWYANVVPVCNHRYDCIRCT